MKTINVKILNNKNNNNQLPKYATLGSSGLDLRAYIKKKKTVKPKQTILISTGLAIHIEDPNITGIIVPRSGLGHKEGIILGNTIGIIDSDYQGPIMLSIWNRKNKTFFIKPQEKIAQLIFIPIIKIKFNVVNKFYPTKRGTQGFGHTGKI